VKKKVIIGILVTMFLVTMVTATFPVRVSAFVGEIEIGLVGPKGWIQWDGLWEGACMARDLINKEGYFKNWPGPRGILGPDGYYKVTLVDIDEHAVPIPDPPSAIAELITKLDTHPKMYHLLGGFLSSIVMPMEEALLDYAAVHKRPIWIVAGASPDELIEPVKEDYARYKYMFRVTPMNSTTLGLQFAALIREVIMPKMAALYNVPKVKFFVIAANVVGFDVMVEYLTDPDIYPYVLGPIAECVGYRRPSPIATDFSTDFDAAEEAGAKIVAHIFSTVAGANFIKQYGALKPKFVCVGINVESQMQEFYASVAGACEYETFLSATGTRTNLNPDAKPLNTEEFWDIYKDIYGHCPIYTAWPAYDGIIGLNETSYDLDPAHDSYGKGWTEYWRGAINGTIPKETAIDKMIRMTETLDVIEGYAWRRVKGYGDAWYRSSILGLFKYTGKDGKYHDVYSNPDCLTPLWETGVARAHIPQWQTGRMEVTWPRDQPFSRKWMIPPWMYPHPDDPTKPFETDFAGGTPAPTGVSALNYTTPDGTVDSEDLDAITEVWFKDLTGLAGFHRLECDMMPYDHFVDVYDAAKVGRDWGKTETPE